MSRPDGLVGRRKIVGLNMLGLVSVALAVTNAFLYAQNRNSQAEVNARAQFLQQSVQLESLYREIVKALAELSVKHSDPQLMQILSVQGISVSLNAPSTLTAPSSPVASLPVTAAPRR